VLSWAPVYIYEEMPCHMELNLTDWISVAQKVKGLVFFIMPTLAPIFQGVGKLSV
jgi:hypothetical protein